MREEVLVVVGCWLERSLIGKDRQKVYKMKREIEERKNGTDKEEKKETKLCNLLLFSNIHAFPPSILPLVHFSFLVL